MAALHSTHPTPDIQSLIFDDPAAWIASSLPLVDLREVVEPRDCAHDTPDQADHDTRTSPMASATPLPSAANATVKQSARPTQPAQPSLSLSSTVRHTVVRLPLSRIDTGELASQLPPRNVPFAVLVDPHTQDARKARNMFSSDTSRLNNSAVKPWSVAHFIDVAALAAVASSLPPPREPDGYAPRVWSPDPMVGTVLHTLLLRGRGHFRRQRVVDLGCGASRDITFLAERHPAAQCLAVDHHPGCEKRARPMFEMHGVDGRVTLRILDLKQQQWWPELMLLPHGDTETQLLVFAIRYLHRPLLEWLALTARPGTTFATSHFCKDRSGTWPFQHPKAKLVLERTEVADVFTEARGWVTELDELVHDSDHGRTLLNFVAQRTASD